MLYRQQRHAKPRVLDLQRDQQRRDQEPERQHYVEPLILELHIEQRRLTLHRQRQFLVAKPLEHVEGGQWIGEHRQREIMPAQSESRVADDRARNGPDHGAEGDRDPRRQVEVKQAERNRVGAQTPERRVAEREVAAVAAQQVPGERQYRPQQDLGQDQLMIGAVQDHEGQHQDGDRKGQDRPTLPVGFGPGSHDRLLMSAR